MVFKLSRTDPSDEWLYAAISFLYRRGYLLPDSAAFELAGRLTKSKRGVVVRRVGDELKKVLRTRYNERLGKRLALRVGKRHHRFDYRPASAVLGPASVDGKVDSTDYSHLDGGTASNGVLTGWANGDINYDRGIDQSDFGLIDNSYNDQAGHM